jgi:uncharacterized protein RhaS with RHS repeats
MTTKLLPPADTVRPASTFILETHTGLYRLGAAGNRTSVAELSDRTVTYGYDSLYRLTSETIVAAPAVKNGTLGYVYDAVGNRQQMTSTLNAIPAGLWNYDANDRLTVQGVSDPAYDNDGNTIAQRHGLQFAMTLSLYS